MMQNKKSEMLIDHYREIQKVLDSLDLKALTDTYTYLRMQVDNVGNGAFERQAEAQEQLVNFLNERIRPLKDVVKGKTLLQVFKESD
jgi:hypothetical protein